VQRQGEARSCSITVRLRVAQSQNQGRRVSGMRNSTRPCSPQASRRLMVVVDLCFTDFMTRGPGRRGTQMTCQQLGRKSQGARWSGSKVRARFRAHQQDEIRIDQLGAPLEQPHHGEKMTVRMTVPLIATENRRYATRSLLSSPLSSQARRSLPLRRQSVPSARRRWATWHHRRGSPGA